MKLMEKFATLTPEQQTKFAAVKDATALDAFASENNITLTDEEKIQAQEYFQSGMLPLDDDDLDAVAGGAAKDAAPGLAAADGRIHMLPAGNTVVAKEWMMCVCNHQNKWARDKLPSDTSGSKSFLYRDVKCYKCGKQASRVHGSK